MAKEKTTQETTEEVLFPYSFPEYGQVIMAKNLEDATEKIRKKV